MASADTRENEHGMKALSSPKPVARGEVSVGTQPPPSSVRAVGGRLLLVDDEAPLLRGLTRLMSLATPEWRVTTATSAEQALAALERESFDVLVTDLEMPGMGGLALLENVAVQYPSLVVVVHSSHSNARAEELADFCLGKPVNTDVLIGTVSTAFATSLTRQNALARTSQTG